MDAVRPVRGARHDLVQEDHVAVPFLDGNIEILDMPVLFRQCRKLEIVSGEKHFGALIREVLYG